VEGKQEKGYWICIFGIDSSILLSALNKRHVENNFMIGRKGGEWGAKEEIENPFTYQLTLNRCLTLWSLSDQCFYFPCLIGC
jgi:hypothetical protein